MTKFSTATLSLATLVLVTACVDPYAPTMRPDYTIRVVDTPHGAVALPPPCPSYANETTDPYDNKPLPQFGCSVARNLAMSVENPEDLVKGRELGPQRGVIAVGAIRRYDNNQTRGLIDPDSSADSSVATTTSSASASAISGDATGSSTTGAAPAAAATGP